MNKIKVTAGQLKHLLKREIKNIESYSDQIETLRRKLGYSYKLRDSIIGTGETVMKSLKSWLNKIFYQKDSPQTSEDLPAASAEVIAISDTEGIGEPILSFIKTFNSSPERFDRISGSMRHGSLVDTITDTGFELYIHPFQGIELSSWKCEPSPRYEKVICFSQKELNYLFDALVRPAAVKCEKAIERRSRMHASREKRLQREQLMEVYCNETRR